MPNEARIALAKWFAKRHGFKGRKGGWIYDAHKGRAVCQGWLSFYQSHRHSIWAEVYSA